jgi:hypothetical protein
MAKDRSQNGGGLTHVRAFRQNVQVDLKRNSAHAEAQLF